MRSISFPTLAVTGAVLLLGCQSTVDPGQRSHTYQQDPPALSFEISGPSQINAEGSFSWEAFAFAGSGDYQYRWEVIRRAGQSKQQPGTTTIGRKLSLHVKDIDGNMLLTLTVTSGNQEKAEDRVVRNCIGGCDAKVVM